MLRRTRFPIAASLLLAGCFSASGGSCEIFPPNGLTGHGSFDYQCIGDDPECDGDIELNARLPAHPVARGAEFRLVYDGDRDVTPVSSAAVTGATVAGSRFSARHAGTVGFFVESLTERGAIEDAVRIRIAEPDRIGLEVRPAGTLASSIPVGGSLRFRVTAFANDEKLSGALPATCSIAETELATVSQVGSAPGSCTVTGVAPGRVHLRATRESLSADVVIEITPGVVGETDAGTDARMDAGNDGDAEVSDASQD